VSERLKCNICNMEVDIAEAKDHAVTKQHAELKSRLESDLNTTRKKEYANDVSVALQWSESTG
jgi:hypothetical protein